MKAKAAPSVAATEILAGIQPVAAALRNQPGSIRLLRVAADSSNQRVRDLVMLAEDAGVEVRKEQRAVLDQLAGLERHQDAVAELYLQKMPEEKDLLPLLAAVDGDPLVLVLDEVQDPHNLGACLRTAEAAGVHAVIVPKDRSASMSPTVRKSSAGASELVPLFQVTNLARCLRALKAAGIWVAGTTGDTKTTLYQQGLSGPLALVMGSEGKGMRRLTAELCDYQLRIPMAGKIESLNVSVATGVCLFEIQRQRHLAKPSG